MITYSRLTNAPDIVEREGGLTCVDDFVCQLLSLEPVVETSQQTEDGAIVSEKGFSQISQETRLSEKHFDRGVVLWIVQDWEQAMSALTLPVCCKALLRCIT